MYDSQINISSIKESFFKTKVKTTDIFTRIASNSPYIVIAPHPDDEIIGMAGTLARLIQKNITGTICYITGQEHSRRGHEAMLGLNAIGIQDAIFLGLEEGDSQEIILDAIVKRIMLNSYGIVFVPSVFELHPDHISVTRAMFKAMSCCDYKTLVIFYEVWSPQMNNGICIIGDVYEQKMNALSCHVSQLKQFPLKELCLITNNQRYRKGPNFFAETFYIGDLQQYHKLLQFRQNI